MSDRQRAERREKQAVMGAERRGSERHGINLRRWRIVTEAESVGPTARGSGCRQR